MLTKGKWLLFVSVITCLFLFASCSRPQKTIHIGYNAWIGDEPVVIAEKKGFFEKEGIKVQLHYFTSLYDVMHAFGANELDIIFSTLNEVLLLAEKGEKIKIVLVADYSNGADVIVAKKPIRSLQELKGKKIGVEVGSISHYTLLRALTKANMSSNKVVLVNTTVEEGLHKFQEGSLDAIATWQPFADQAVRSNGHIIFSSSEIPGEIVDVIAMRQSFIDENPEACFAIVSAYLNALDWFNKNKKEGLSIISEATKISPAELALQLEGIHLTPLTENLAALGSPQGTLYLSLQKFMQFLLENKLMTKSVNTNDIIYPDFILKYKEQYNAI